MTATTSRLEARISPDIHAMVKRAAELQGRTVTDFVSASLREAAREAIEESMVLHLSMDDQVRFAEALLNPPEPSPALVRAFEHRKRLLGIQ